MRPHYLPKHHGSLDGWVVLGLCAIGLSALLVGYIAYALFTVSN